MRSSALERESLRSAFMGAIVAPSWLRAKNFIVNVAYILRYATVINRFWEGKRQAGFSMACKMASDSQISVAQVLHFETYVRHADGIRTGFD